MYVFCVRLYCLYTLLLHLSNLFPSPFSEHLLVDTFANTLKITIQTKTTSISNDKQGEDLVMEGVEAQW